MMASWIFLTNAGDFVTYVGALDFLTNAGTSTIGEFFAAVPARSAGWMLPQPP